MVKKRIIFVSHNATRTGAPILLLTIIRWFKQNTNHDIRVLLIDGGEIADEFFSVCPGLILRDRKAGMVSRMIQHLIRNFNREDGHALRLRKARKYIFDFSPDLIYANTAVSLAYLAKFSFVKGYKLLCHLHELNIAISLFAGHDKFSEAIPTVNHFICPARAVKNNLVVKYRVAESIIDVIPEPIEIIVNSRRGVDIRSQLNLSPNDFIVMSAGTTDWRKGPDLFIQTAYLVNKLSCVYFVWVGKLDEITSLKFAHDIEKLRLEKRVFFLGLKENPMDYFASADLFYLTSREDPYPLVCLEAASLAKPILCFRDAGGMPEFVKEDAGIVIPYLDLDLACESILRLKEDRIMSRSLGETAKGRVIRQSSINSVGKRILDVTNRLLVK